MSTGMDSYNILITGAAGVGKTLLATQFTGDGMTDLEPRSSADDDHVLCRALRVDNRMCAVQLIDAVESGVPDDHESRFRPIHAVALIYSVTDRASFERIEALHELTRSPRGGRERIVVLLANKCDAAYRREVSREEGKMLAEKLECVVFETSAKTMQNVHAAFVAIVRQIRERKETELREGARGMRTASRSPRCLIL
ncbi:ras protein [Phanerochaete sordida]|uniref:Ras protein n=1 Tax=Phanerochaete sordida TaxID=48140 RepID=A0A9P3LDB2_9APHY|nr:ras protein [Phanerochaete sordida]